MMIVRRKLVGGVLAAVAASGLVFATGAPAAADVAPHKHCLLTPDGWVLVAEGVTDKAPNLALEKLHVYVHIGVPGSGGEPLRIVRIDADQDCSGLPVPSAV
jgi:hypothetical protein